MNLKVMIGVSVLALGFTTAATAATNYYVPERINCSMNAGTLSCDSFNRLYLSEDTTTADFPTDQSYAFHFSEATAYVDPRTEPKQYTVFFSFTNAKGKMVNLKTVNTSIQPAMENSSWKVSKDIYRCKDIETKCPITNLPA